MGQAKPARHVVCSAYTCYHKRKCRLWRQTRERFIDQSAAGTSRLAAGRKQTTNSGGNDGDKMSVAELAIYI